MPIYIAQSDVQAAVPAQDFLDATDRNLDGAPDTAVVNDAIDAGEGRFHKYVGRRYKLPLDKTDPILFGAIKRILVDFAWEAMFPRADMVPAELVTRNADHEKALQDIRDGNDDLPATTPPAAASTESKVIWSTGCPKNPLP